jgi:hypothetical protein
MGIFEMMNLRLPAFVKRISSTSSNLTRISGPQRSWIRSSNGDALEKAQSTDIKGVNLSGQLNCRIRQLFLNGQ